jgi:uncharacterized protein
MRWQRGHRSPNVEDRRGFPIRRGVGIGAGGLILLVVLGVLTGQNPLDILSQLPAGTEQIEPSAPLTPEQQAAEDEAVQFVSFVLDDAQDTWRQILPAQGATYRDARLVLFRDAVESACGLGQAAMGPFYCAGDERVYIDLGFYQDLRERFGAPGDFAQAYVIAHEIGHHVQNLLGIEQRFREAQQRSPGDQNELSVRFELQADCLAGIWGHSTAKRDILHQGDVEEGLNAAAAIGDDRIQRMSNGRVSPESFTHGSSEQRVGWFRRGLERGDVAACDTFSGA